MYKYTHAHSIIVLSLRSFHSSILFIYFGFFSAVASSLLFGRRLYVQCAQFRLIDATYGNIFVREYKIQIAHDDDTDNTDMHTGNALPPDDDDDDASDSNDGLME